MRRPVTIDGFIISAVLLLSAAGSSTTPTGWSERVAVEPNRASSPTVPAARAARASQEVEAVSVRRANFLIVVTDDQRFDQLGAAGHPVLQTPAMDSLASVGVRFTEAFVTTPICAASRASLLTGRREGRHGYTFGTAPMGESLAEESYPARLRAAGYRTGFVGKWGVRFEKGLVDRMFDEFAPMSLPYRRDGAPHLTDRVARGAIEFLDGVADDEPFCLSVSFWAPHAQDGHPDQYLPPVDLADLYGDVDVPEPPHAVEGFDVLPGFIKESLGRKRWAWRFDTPEKRVRCTRDYWRLITGVDGALGRIIGALEERGARENTVVVFTSDNGYFLGERGLAGKWFNYEESIRVPLIIVDPRIPGDRRGRTSPAMVLNVDVAPTVLELAELPVPASYSGRSLVPWLRGEAPSWRDDFLVEHRFAHPEIPVSVGIRATRWVYTRYDGIDPVYEQLFDLRTDPHQLRDLAREPKSKGVLQELCTRCDELLEEE